MPVSFSVLDPKTLDNKKNLKRNEKIVKINRLKQYLHDLLATVASP